jgi:hypothetical protein
MAGVVWHRWIVDGKVHFAVVAITVTKGTYLPMFIPKLPVGKTLADVVVERNKAVKPDAMPRELIEAALIVTVASWQLLKQKLLITGRHQADRAARKRAERANIVPSEVQVVVWRKRRYRYEDKDHEPAQVDWSCRWWVTGHWRHFKDGRVTRIDEYLKNRDRTDLPIKSRSRANVVER